MRRRPAPMLLVPMLLAIAPACREQAPPPETPPAAAAPDLPASPAWIELQDTTTRIASVTGLEGPEAVRFDPDQDVWFVSNFGSGDVADGRDGDGYLTRVTADGTVETQRFAVGTPAAPLHMPRGMFITGDTLWVADVDGVHGFDRRSGEHLHFVDFRAHEPGFLNDIAAEPEGDLYVTDTGRSRLYRVTGRDVAVAVEDPRLGPPNGIAWDASQQRFVLAPWGGERTVRAWSPGAGVQDLVTTTGGFMDGVEIMDGRIVVASQADSSLHVLENGGDRVLVRLPGAPADIGVDRERRRVAVPYVSLGRVDVWSLLRDGR